MNKLICFITCLLAAPFLIAQTFTNIAPDNNIIQTFGTGYQGGGVSMYDFNNDGWDDLTFCTGTGQNVLFFQNNNGSFQQITAPITNTAETKETIWVDYDNDGDKDLYVTTRASGSYLYKNNGGFTFTDVTTTAFGGAGSEITFGADWADINHDGLLDLYLCLYYDNSGPANKLYLNNGNGTFTNIGIGQSVNDGGKLSFDANFFDYDRDGWADIYVVNDRYNFANGLYRNNGNLTFTDAGASSGTGISINAMNSGSGDFNNDGWPDLYVTNTPQGNVLFSNNGNGTFSDVTASAGVGFFRIGWAASFCDFDNDMDQDLYVSCMSQTDENTPSAMYMNQGNGTFTEPLLASGGLGGDDYGNSFSHAVGDFNNDGKADIAVSQMFGDPFLLWQNNMTNTGNWVKVRLSGTVSNSEGIGAWIEVWNGGNMQNRYTHCTMGYLGQHSGNYPFGIGANTSVDSIIVSWPSGMRDKMTNINTVNQVIYIGEGDFALPVTLLDFRLQSSNTSGTELNWVTSEEINTKLFEVQRSYDGRSFVHIGEVNASGGSNQLQRYNFIDEATPDRMLYYRLKMLDHDGSFEYSPIRSIQHAANTVNETAFFLRALPQNPVINQQIKCGIFVSVAGRMNVSLVSGGGTVVRQQLVDLTTGENELSLETEKLPAGLYFLRLEMNGLIHGIQLVIT